MTPDQIAVEVLFVRSPDLWLFKRIFVLPYSCPGNICTTFEFSVFFCFQDTSPYGTGRQTESAVECLFSLGGRVFCHFVQDLPLNISKWCCFYILQNLCDSDIRLTWFHRMALLCHICDTIMFVLNFYLCQVNEVNGGVLFSFSMFLSVCVCAAELSIRPV